MQRLWLSGKILPVGARLVVQHVFRSEEEQPLEVIYSFPLPRDAALRSFRIVGEGFEANSELRQTEAAVAAYEQGIADGSLSALAREHGDGVINLTVGNIRPHETVTLYLELLAGVESHDDGYRFRFPFTLSPTYHPRMRVATTDGTMEIELPASEFGDVVLPPIRKDATRLHEVGFDLEVLHQCPIEEVGSPSHAIRVRPALEGPVGVALATGKDIPNRDLVLDVKFRQPDVQVFAGGPETGRRHFAAVLPSHVFGKNADNPRRTAILLDRSGSMQGDPIAQAKKAIEACLGVLSAEDSFGLVAFDDRIDSMEDGLVNGSRENRERARQFLTQVDARGGTQLAAGVVAAARMLNGGGDLLILTDGQVSGTEKILEQARATNLRLFCLGIGSASQDRFLSLLARETGGISRFVGAQERVDLAAVDLFASMGTPVASDLKATGKIQPEPPKAVFTGTPAILFGELEADDANSIDVTWAGGSRTIVIPQGDRATGEAVRLLQGSRLITDWEIRYPHEEALATLERRKQGRVAMRLAELSQAYGLASREMSLVAVVKRAGDQPGGLPETRVVPLGMLQGTDFNAYAAAPPQTMFGLFAAAPPAPSPMQAGGALDRSAAKRIPLVGMAPSSPGMFTRMIQKVRVGSPTKPEPPAPPKGPDLMDLAAQLEPDGGMPGKSASARAGRTVVALLAFLAEGHTSTSGAFRSHVARLVRWLKSVTGVSNREREVIDLAIRAVEASKAPEGKWLELTARADGAWKELERAL